MSCLASRRWTLPSWSVLPLISLATTCIIVIIMVPMYVKSGQLRDANDAPRLYPANLTMADIQQGSRNDMVSLGMDLVTVNPEVRSATFSVIVSLGMFMGDPSDGVVVLPDNCSLTLSIGHQSLQVQSGDALSTTAFQFFLVQTVSYFQYPFDEYMLNLTIRATLVNNTNNQVLKTPLPLGVLLLGGSQGWNTQSQITPYTSGGVQQPGAVLFMALERSVSVKFCSMFVVILMWLVSLAMFSLAVNFTMSSRLDLSYEIPTLAVGLLFALPLVREIQPDVPTVGISIDVMGFFFNMLLVTIATIMAIATLSSRYYRVLKLEDRKRREENHVTGVSEHLVDNRSYKLSNAGSNGRAQSEAGMASLNHNP